jgi:hypothetical protein
VARPPRRPDRPRRHPAWPARFGAAALRRVARAVQRAADTLAPAASPAAAVSPPAPPPRLPGQPPEHWLAVVREHAPELLIGREQATFDRPSPPAYAQPPAVPPARRPHADASAIAAAHRTASGHSSTPVAAAIRTASGTAVNESSALPSHAAEADRAAGRTREWASENRVSPAKPLTRWAGAVWERLSGKARTEASPVDGSLHSGQTGSPVPAMRLNPAPATDRFPAWSWLGPGGDANEKSRPAHRTTAAEWPRLPAISTRSAGHRARAAVSHPAEPWEMNEETSPWPDLPDDTPLWTTPVAGHSSERLGRLEREQAGA